MTEPRKKRDWSLTNEKHLKDLDMAIGQAIVQYQRDTKLSDAELGATVLLPCLMVVVNGFRIMTGRDGLFFKEMVKDPLFQELDAVVAKHLAPYMFDPEVN